MNDDNYDYFGHQDFINCCKDLVICVRLLLPNVRQVVL